MFLCMNESLQCQLYDNLWCNLTFHDLVMYYNINYYLKITF